MPAFSKALEVPMFNFPPEPPPCLTKEMLFAIFKLYSDTTKSDQESTAPSRESCCLTMLQKASPKSGSIRSIFQTWPRSADGKFIPSDWAQGCMAPNGIKLWGETLFDFYLANHAPEMFGVAGYSTSSRLLSFVEEHGELDAAKEEIKWARGENPPRIVTPYPIDDIIKGQENNILEGLSGSLRPEAIDNIREATDQPWESYGVVPFSYQAPMFNQKIPLRLLPDEIEVHDPWTLLSVDLNSETQSETPSEDSVWMKAKYKTHKYKLKLSSAGERRLQEEPEIYPYTTAPEIHEETISVIEIDDDGVPHVRGDEGLFINPPKSDSCCVSPAVFVEYRPKPTTVPVSDTDTPSHLYLSPSHAIGKGNHSMVYNAEWDLARNVVLNKGPPSWIMCSLCAHDDAFEQLAEIDGPNEERKEQRWKDKLAWYSEKKVRITIPSDITIDVPNSDGSLSSHTGELDPGRSRTHATYRGPLRRLVTRIDWQHSHQPTCPHLKSPLNCSSARVRVVAKLSMQDDRHLAREAANYQEFDSHMLEHWNGYNLIRPSHEPVPVRAIVPEFYGYYVPVENDLPSENAPGETTHPEAKSYLSPILLLEGCGRQIQLEDLTKDERNEAVSLYRRFHHAGWSHGSVHARNILAQYGPLETPPWKRGYDKDTRTLSFRLIDFGRSRYNEANLGDPRSHPEHRSVDDLYEVGLGRKYCEF